MNHGDRDAPPENPPEQGERHTDLVPGERQPMLLRDDARHAKPYGQRQPVTQDEERRRDRVHRSSMPEKPSGVSQAGVLKAGVPKASLSKERRGVHGFAEYPVPDLDVSELERRQEPVGVAPR